MAIAHLAPKTGRDFRFYISHHAIERFRQRAESELRNYTDRDLGLVLDERIYAAIAASRDTDVVDKGQPDENTKIVAIQMRSGPDMHVVMRTHRPNSYPPMKTIGGPAGAALAAITVVTEDMAANNYAKGYWFVAERAGAGNLRQPLANKDAVRELAALRDKIPAERRVGSGVRAAVAADVLPPKPSRPAATPAEEEKSGLGGTRKERSDYLLTLFRKDSTLDFNQASTEMAKKFGPGISRALYDRVRAQTATSPKPTPSSTPSAPPTPAPAPPSDTERIAKIATDYARACSAQKVLNEHVETLTRDLEGAKEAVAKVAAEVARLFGELQGIST